jgi:hypothetical protein
MPPGTWRGQQRFNFVFGPFVFTFGFLPILAVGVSWLVSVLTPPVSLAWTSVPPLAQPWVAAFLVLGVARGLFALRSAARQAYGRLEIAGAFVAAYATLNDVIGAKAPEISLSVGLSLASACYIAVRGFDNADVGEMKKKELRQFLISTVAASDVSYRTWAEHVKRQHDDFASYKSDYPHQTNESVVSDGAGTEYVVRATPWWYNTIGGDVVIEYSLQSKARAWDTARYNYVIRKPSNPSTIAAESG